MATTRKRPAAAALPSGLAAHHDLEQSAAAKYDARVARPWRVMTADRRLYQAGRIDLGQLEWCERYRTACEAVPWRVSAPDRVSVSGGRSATLTDRQLWAAGVIRRAHAAAGPGAGLLYAAVVQGRPVRELAILAWFRPRFGESAALFVGRVGERTMARLAVVIDRCAHKPARAGGDSVAPQPGGEREAEREAEAVRSGAGCR